MSITQSRRTTLQVMGGLGNQMFMFASAKSLTDHWDRQLVLSPSWFEGRQRGSRFSQYRRGFLLSRFPKIAEAFAVTQSFPTLPIKLLHKQQRVLTRTPLGIYFEQAPGFDSWLLHHAQRVLVGYFQTPTYFERDRLSLQGCFRLSESEEVPLRRRYETLNSSGQRTVMVHVRREDSLVAGNGWAGLLSPEFYAEAMSLSSTSDVNFLVFSDSPQWCKAQRVFKRARIVDEPDPVKTLRLMSYCDDFIIAGSTLSWWAAWLGDARDKRVFAPSPFFRSSPKETWAQLLLPDWMPVQAQWE